MDEIHQFLLDFGRFIVALASEFVLIIVFGVVGALFEIIERRRDTRLPMRWYWIVAALLTCFFAWRKEDRARRSAVEDLAKQAAINESKRPKLSGEILQTTTGNENQDRKIVLLLHMKITNSGADSAATGFTLRIVSGHDGAISEPVAPFELAPHGLVISEKSKAIRRYQNADTIYEKGMVPIRAGDVRTGVALYRLSEDLGPKDGDNLMVSFNDYLGNQYVASAPYRVHKNDPYSLVPGIGSSPPEKSR